MSTNMPRENLYITTDIRDKLVKHSCESGISKSMLSRHIYEFWFDLHHDEPESKALTNFASAKNVTPLDVILALIRKYIPKEYQEDGNETN